MSKYSNALVDFIKRKKPLVIGLNTASINDDSLVDLRVACHPMRLVADFEFHYQDPTTLVMPLQHYSQDHIDKFPDKKLINYPLSIKPNKFSFLESGCICPNRLVVSYALAIATSINPENIYMAGFDGYSPGSKKNSETTAVLDIYSKYADLSRLLSLTPTLYPIQSASVYSPLL